MRQSPRRNTLLYLVFGFVLSAQLLVSYHSADHTTHIHDEACVTYLIGKHTKAIVNSIEVVLAEAVSDLFDFSFSRTAPKRETFSQAKPRAPPSV
jgi:hypothetical protein